MGLREDVAMAEAKLNLAIQQVMEGQVADLARDAMTQAVETEVYDAYTPIKYQRRRSRDGGLQDTTVMAQHYDPVTRTLTLENLSRDNRSGRLIPPLIEEGKGYRMHQQDAPFPRPFHAEAERLMGEGLFEDGLADGLARMGYQVKK